MSVCVQATKKSQASSKKAPKESSADKIRRQNAEAKQSKQKSASEIWWTEQLSTIAGISSIEAKQSHLRGISRNDKFQQGWLGVEFRLLNIDLELRRWVEEASGLSDREKVARVRDRYTVSVMKAVKGLYDKYPLTPSALKPLKTVLLALGFSSYLEGLSKSAHPPGDAGDEEDRPLSFSFIKLWSSSKKVPVYEFMKIEEHPTRWQLRLFGEFMDRSMDSQRDGRVSFEPDRWQREVLDCLDANESVLVVGELCSCCRWDT